MPFDQIDLPVIGRAAEVRADSIDAEARTIEIVWTTGAVVQRRRWEGWDDLVEYDEELIVSANAIRLERLNDGAPFLNSHSSWDLSSVLGNVVPGSVRIEGGKGYATIRLTSAPDAEAAVHRILERTVNKVSVGYRVHAYEIEKRDGQREIWRAVDWEPYEISAVAMPADAGAQIRSEGADQTRNACVVTRRDPPAASAAQPEGQTMPPEDNTQGAGAIDTRGTTQAPTASQQPAQPTADQIRTEERQRASTITTLCERHGMTAEFRNGLIDNGTSVEAARGQILDKLAEGDSIGARSTSPAPAQARGDGDLAYRTAMQEAIGHQLAPGREISAGAREFRGMRLVDMARDILERGGVRTRGMSGMEVAGMALAVRSAGVGYHTTSDFGAILANVLNNTLRQAYLATPRTFTPWARRATISDFRPVQRSQLGGAPDLLKVPEGAEFKYGTMGDGKETYALTTYGRIMAVTRQVIVNNEFDIVARIAAAFGSAAADLESDLVYGILTANPAMADGKALFHADHGNLASSGSVINETALSSVYRGFGQQKGIEKRPISILPRYIIVPPGSRSVEARKMITATTPGSTAEVNAYANRGLEVIEEPRLIPSSGQDPWFMSADPARIDTVEYAYLEGQEGVHTEERSGFEVDGVEVKARHDFAAKAIDWRGLYKNTGAAAAA